MRDLLTMLTNFYVVDENIKNRVEKFFYIKFKMYREHISKGYGKDRESIGSRGYELKDLKMKFKNKV